MREEAVHRALHELRRPLQALALGLAARPGRGSESGRLVEQVELAALAMSDLEAAVEGESPQPWPRLLDVMAEIERAAERWRLTVAARGRRLNVRGARRATVIADPLRLAQALDNLIANAVEHGSGAIAVEGRTGPGWARIAVRDEGPAERRPDGRERGPGLRHGHGLKVAASIAAAHGGRLAFHRSRRGSTATIELPLAEARQAPPLGHLSQAA